MRKSEAMTKLREQAGFIRSQGATALYLFGSTARDQADADSDVDMFIDFDVDRFSFVELIRLREGLSAALGCPADLATRDGLHPRLRDAIESQALRVL
jgi:predicted nucleotidyltransferase